MSDIYEIKVVARNKSINLIKDGTLQGGNAGFVFGAGSSYYMKTLTFSALMKHQC